MSDQLILEYAGFWLSRVKGSAAFYPPGMTSVEEERVVALALARKNSRKLRNA
jgi:hypothetical protein